MARHRPNDADMEAMIINCWAHAPRRDGVAIVENDGNIGGLCSVASRASFVVPKIGAFTRISSMSSAGPPR